MVLEELTTVPSGVLPVSEFAEHLHLGTGFADDGSQNAVLEAYLRASLAAIEARTGKALITRQFSWQLTAWRDGVSQGLPVAPVSAISAVKLVDAAGGEYVVDQGDYKLERDSQRPRIVTSGSRLPAISSGGVVEIEFSAGYGPNWPDLPVDLAQAVFLLAAHFYENRSVGGRQDDLMPFGVMALIETYRSVRVLGGGV